MRVISAVLFAGALVMFLSVISPEAKADTWNEKTIVTFDYGQAFSYHSQPSEKVPASAVLGKWRNSGEICLASMGGGKNCFRRLDSRTKDPDCPLPASGSFQASAGIFGER